MKHYAQLTLDRQLYLPNLPNKDLIWTIHEYDIFEKNWGNRQSKLMIKLFGKRHKTVPCRDLHQQISTEDECPNWQLTKCSKHLYFLIIIMDARAVTLGHQLASVLRRLGFCLFFVFCFFFGLFGVFLSHSRIFHSYGDVTIADEERQILTYVGYSWSLSSDGS